MRVEAPMPELCPSCVGFSQFRPLTLEVRVKESRGAEEDEEEHFQGRHPPIADCPCRPHNISKLANISISSLCVCNTIHKVSITAAHI